MCLKDSDSRAPRKSLPSDESIDRGTSIGEIDSVKAEGVWEQGAEEDEALHNE
jgi:hypothetical protein